MEARRYIGFCTLLFLPNLRHLKSLTKKYFGPGNLMGINCVNLFVINTLTHS